ncbi:hypothetical protein NP590_14320 [Methylomonas sp. SURF-2]|uniref:Uncharacterized protein n=1 Tax=Methylomonas subterranea TaxID=2952225 RepID=A0ABT1TJP1_9GAMM|nr:hypothetical protein [Methylomonas sp. SURF-2]MCQ8105287.1 hypothetical protein [Methylomonas sp. SURF-2]
MNFVARIALPAAIAFTGYIIAEKDRSLKYIELAASFLNTEQNPDVRDWAVDVINNYSDVKMSGKVKQAISGKIEAIETSQDKARISGHVSSPHLIK